jgi:hypothetical protein
MRALPRIQPGASAAIRGTIAAVALALGAAGQARAEVSFLPRGFVRLEGDRYFPSEDDQVWSTWVGAGADMLQAGPVIFEFTADVETIIGRELRTFDPNQANYHLAGAMRVPVKGDEVTPFFHHVSRHEIDRPKVQAVDWNIMGVRARMNFADGRAWVVAGIGHTIGDTPVGYGWELTLRAEAEPLRLLYGAADVRHVSAEPVALFPRGSFTDLSLDGGVRWRRGAHAIDVFAAFERRNDIFVQAPGVRDRLLLGFRIGPVGRTRAPR